MKQAVNQFDNAGQVCLAGTRLLVEDAIFDEFLARFTEASAAIRQGDPREETSDIGPLITREHFERVDGFVQRAKAEGTRGRVRRRSERGAGEACSTGRRCSLEPPSGSEILQQEVFGPVLTLQRFSGEEDGIAKANDTTYGLSAIVYSGDQEKADRVSSALVAGTVWVNCFYVRDLRVPFGGSRNSGIGREGGFWSFDFYADVKNVVTAPWDDQGDLRGAPTMGEIVGAGTRLARPHDHAAGGDPARDQRREGDHARPGAAAAAAPRSSTALGPDTFVVMDTHWEVTFEHIITAHEKREGIFTSHELPRGMRQIPYEMPGDPELAFAVSQEAEGRDDTWVLASDDPYLPIFYGTVNIWSYLKEGPEKWVSVGINQCGTTEDFLLLGQLIGEAVLSLDRKVVLLASGGLSHRFLPFRELRGRESSDPMKNIITPEAREADLHVLDLLQKGDHAVGDRLGPRVQEGRPGGASSGTT